MSLSWIICQEGFAKVESKMNATLVFMNHISTYQDLYVYRGQTDYLQIVRESAPPNARSPT